jgi:hypothetical protein
MAHPWKREMVRWLRDQLRDKLRDRLTATRA